MMAQSFKSLKKFGQSVWLDNLSRHILEDGSLKRDIEEDGVTGVTSNPSIFQKALSEGDYYSEDLARLKAQYPDPERRYEALVIPDIQAACDMFRSVYDATGGNDGYVSLEVSPTLAYDVGGTVAAAERLRAMVKRDNLLIKVPATPEGAVAFEEMIARGMKVNITLMFSMQHIQDIFAAYERGLRRWIASGGDPRPIKAVASVFLSRVDTLVDKRLEQIGTPQALALRGQAAIALMKRAYQHYMNLFHGPQFADLIQQGARPQYLLWASTGTKNPAYSDVMYVENLIGPETINTMPDSTLAAFRDHGQAAIKLTEGIDQAEATLSQLLALGIDMDAVGLQLQQEGVKLFEDAFEKLLQQVA